MMIRFAIFGVTGWCMEVLWTGLASLLLKGDVKMTSSTSIWMFFIYGLGAFFAPLINGIIRYPLFVRGSIYVVLIFLAEFLSGYLMTQFNACPWDYSDARFNIMGIIRLDYAPVWFAVGLLFEQAHLRLDGII